MSSVNGPVKKTVTEWLNDVDYHQDDNYIPSEFSLEFVNFIKLVNGKTPEEHKTPVVHYRMLDQIPGRKQNIINMCARGLSKTTLMGQYLILYIAVYGFIPGYGKIDYALYISDAVENGIKKMRLRLERLCQHKTFLKQYLDEAKFTDIRWYFRNKAGKEFVVTGHGGKSGVRGTVELGTRPQLAILDDLLSDEDARSPTVIANIENTVYKAIDFAMHPSKRKIIWSGTPFNAKDPLYKAVESGAWYVNVYPICNEFPCKKEEYAGAWPDRFPWEYVRDKYDKLKLLGKVDAFNQEMMLRIMSDDDRLIRDEDIQWYNIKSVLNNKSAFNYYITTDFAVSEKESTDYSVISVWAVNHKGWWFWVDGICRRQLMDKNIDDLFSLAQRWKPQSVGVEVSGQQSGFVAWIYKEMAEKNIWFNMASENNENKPGIRPTTNKMMRFNIVVPWFKGKRMYFPIEAKHTPEMEECMNELKLASPGGFKSKHDDFIDNISMLGSMTVFYPSETMEMRQDTGTNLWEVDDTDDEFSGRINSYIV